jgi:hypothetical protein
MNLVLILHKLCADIAETMRNQRLNVA